MTEHKFIPIDELINRVMMQLKEQHYMESTLIVYNVYIVHFEHSARYF